jgi:hypothetical protein
MAMIDASASVAGKRRGVPRVVGRVVDGLDVGEADAEEQKHAEQPSEQGWHKRFGPSAGQRAIGPS